MWGLAKMDEVEKVMLSKDYLMRQKVYFDTAKKSRKDIKSLSVYQFLKAQGAESDWAIGPFIKNQSMTFRKTMQWKDPLNINWESNSIFNPSLIEHEGQLFMFYRAAPQKESLCSRVGLAVFKENTGWVDYTENPILYPTDENESLGCEDPKIYKVENEYFMFYNGIWDLSFSSINRNDKLTTISADLACDVKVAVSKDLYHWEKRGIVVPYSFSKHWAKSAVIPRDSSGRAVKINGAYIMYVSEGCGGHQLIGLSQDMFHWRFDQKNYLYLSQREELHEVACAVFENNRIVLDYYYKDENGNDAGGQVLYNSENPFKQIARHNGATLSWGGLIRFNNKWMFAQGWDAPDQKEKMYFYQGPIHNEV